MVTLFFAFRTQVELLASQALVAHSSNFIVTVGADDLVLLLIFVVIVGDYLPKFALFVDFFIDFLVVVGFYGADKLIHLCLYGVELKSTILCRFRAPVKKLFHELGVLVSPVLFTVVNARLT